AVRVDDDESLGRRQLAHPGLLADIRRAAAATVEHEDERHDSRVERAWNVQHIRARAVADANGSVDRLHAGRPRALTRRGARTDCQRHADENRYGRTDHRGQINTAMRFRTSVYTFVGTWPTTSALRARQSRLRTWSERTAP